MHMPSALIVSNTGYSKRALGVPFRYGSARIIDTAVPARISTLKKVEKLSAMYNPPKAVPCPASRFTPASVRIPTATQLSGTRLRSPRKTPISSSSSAPTARISSGPAIWTDSIRSFIIFVPRAA